MLEDLAMRGLRSETQHDYVRVVRSFAAFLRQLPPSPAPPDVSPSGIVGLLRRERVLLRDELEGQAAAGRDRAASYGTVLKMFEHHNRLALDKTDVHIDTSLGEDRGPRLRTAKRPGRTQHFLHLTNGAA
jgi:hypothetical protein